MPTSPISLRSARITSIDPRSSGRPAKCSWMRGCWNSSSMSRTSVPALPRSDCEASHSAGSALGAVADERRGTFVPNDREFKKRLLAGALSDRFGLALLEGDAVSAERVVRDAFEDEMPYAMIHDAIVAPALQRIGKLWELGEIGVAHEHLATQISLRV